MTSDQSAAPGGLAERLISLIWRKPAETLGEQTRRRVTFYLIPFLFFLYILAYLDRVNVSVAQLRMELPAGEGGVGFSEPEFGFGAGLFFLGYWILEIPSTVSVVRWGARWVFVRILVLWGICAALAGTIGTPFASSLFSWLPHMPIDAAWVQSVDSITSWLFGWINLLLRGDGVLHPASLTAQFFNGLQTDPKHQFYFFRFMLGFFEGGFFPSVIVYLSFWFRAQDRAKAIASFMAAIPLASMLGLPLSGLLLDFHWFGLPGWRWIFILEGIAPILAGFATLFFLPDRPAKAHWLPAVERDWLLAELEVEQQGKQDHGHRAWVQHLGMVLLLTGVYFCLNLTSYGLSMFMPAIIKSQVNEISKAQEEPAPPAEAIDAGDHGPAPPPVKRWQIKDWQVSCLASLPFVLAFIGMLVNGWHSDKTGERPWHVAVPLFLLGTGILLCYLLDRVPVVPVILMIFCVGTFMYAHLPAFWPIPTMFLGATAAASAIGFINMVGNLGGSVGPTMVGKAAAGQQSFADALLLLAPWPMAAAVIILVVAYLHRRTKVYAKSPGNLP